PPAVLAAVDVVGALRGGEWWARIPVLPPGAGPPPGPGDRRAFELDPGRALLADGAGAPRFSPAARSAPHVRHWDKSAEGTLPPERRFHFREIGRSAANLIEFYRLLARATEREVHHHLKRGDFSRWLSDVLWDDELAGRIRGIERWYQARRDPRPEATRAAL